MHTVLVTFVLPTAIPRAKILEAFEKSAPRFRAAPGLIRKYYSYDEANHTGHSVYLWESEAAARAYMDDGFVTSFQERFGTTPELFHVDTLVVVDNEQERIVVNAGEGVS